MTPLKSNESIILSVVILFLVSATQSVNVYLNGELHYFNTPYSRYGHIEFNITGAGLAVADPIDLCSDQQVDWTNKIVITSKVGCSPTTKIRLAQERGAVAIIAHETSTNGPSGNVYWKTVDGRWAPNTSLPFVTINAPDGDKLKSLVLNTTANDTLTADVDPTDHNEWIIVLDTSNAYMGVAIALILANTAGLGFALSRLVSLIMAKGCSRTTAHLTLSFIVAMHTSTIIYYVVNIIDIKMGPVAPDLFYTIFLIMPELLQMLSSLIVSLYWFELINSVTSKPMMFLKKLFKPFVAFAIIISVLYVVVIIMSGLYIADLPILILLFVFLILSLAVATIWLVVGAKLIYQLQNNAKLREKKKKATNFNRLSAFIILCAVFLFLTRAMYLVLSLDPAVYADPWFWLPIATLIYIFQLITAYIQTGLFKLHKRDFKSTTTSKGSDRDSTRNSHRASVHGGMNMSAVATKGESVNDTLSEENFVSGEETKRTATSVASSDLPVNNKESSDESSSQKEALNEIEEKSGSASQSEKEDDESGSSSAESNSGSNSG